MNVFHVVFSVLVPRGADTLYVLNTPVLISFSHKSFEFLLFLSKPIFDGQFFGKTLIFPDKF